MNEYLACLILSHQVGPNFTLRMMSSQKTIPDLQATTTTTTTPFFLFSCEFKKNKIKSFTFFKEKKKTSGRRLPPGSSPNFLF